MYEVPCRRPGILVCHTFLDFYFFLHILDMFFLNFVAPDARRYFSFVASETVCSLWIKFQLCSYQHGCHFVFIPSSLTGIIYVNVCFCDDTLSFSLQKKISASISANLWRQYSFHAFCHLLVMLSGVPNFSQLISAANYYRYLSCCLHSTTAAIFLAY